MTSSSTSTDSGANAQQKRTRSLDQCRKGETLCITELLAQPAFGAQDEQVTLRLKELGFLPGVTMTVLGYGFLGRDPLAVKIAGTKFALRRNEASKVAVTTAEGQS